MKGIIVKLSTHYTEEENISKISNFLKKYEYEVLLIDDEEMGEQIEFIKL